MARVMVMIEIPDMEYAELESLMRNRKSSPEPGVSFDVVKGKIYQKVEIHRRYVPYSLDPLRAGFLRFDLIGVRP